MSSDPNGTPHGSRRREPGRGAAGLAGLNPLGLMEGVLGGQSTDWEPPMASDLETCIPGYRDFQYIDRGGMGAVYAATQTSLERRVAVKILPPDLGEDITFVDGFHREARLLAKLQHPHVVAVYDFGRNSLGHLYIVMEYVEGTSLLDIMKSSRLTVPRVLEIIVQVCQALQFAHDHGVIHRDIKPTNILIDVRGSVRVADFGLARLIRQDSTTTAQTRSALIMGTPVYAAPEQRRPQSDVDCRADIFSVGVTMYEMITSHVPVGFFEPPSRKSESPAILDKIIIKALRERPEDRYQKASDLGAAVQKAADRISKPVIQHTIAQRPIISMMTTVIVTSCLIYLFGEVNALMTPKPGFHLREDAAGGAFFHLDDTFVLLTSRMDWKEARDHIRSRPDLEIASIHSSEESARVSRLLRDRGIRSPVWIGGWQSAAGGPFQWSDGTPFDFEAWMPAAASPPVIITEIQAKNRTTLRTAAGDTPDWIEVFNPGNAPVDLTGWQLRHITGPRLSGGRLGGASSPGSAKLSIGPGEYRVITCHDLAEDTGMHFNFQLEAQGGRIVWADPRGNVVQALNRDWDGFPGDATLISGQDGMQWGWSMEPTPGRANSAVARPTTLSAIPPPAEPAAIFLLPEFEGRWTAEVPRRHALALARKKAAK